MTDVSRRLPSRDLRFWIEIEGRAAHQVDLTEFAEGRCHEDVPPQSRTSWAGDFSGRPVMALQIAEMLRAAPRPESSVKAVRSALRAFYRFLDSENCPDGAAVQSVCDVKDVHGPMFYRWLSGKSSSQYGKAKTALDQMRQMAGLGPLFWPARTGDSIAVVDAVDELGMRRLFNALKYEARLIKSMFREGEQPITPSRAGGLKGNRQRRL